MAKAGDVLLALTVVAVPVAVAWVALKKHEEEEEEAGGELAEVTITIE